MGGQRQQSVELILAARALNWPAAASPISQFMISVLRLSKRAMETTATTCDAHGLSYAEFEVLAALRSAPAPHELIPTVLSSGVLISSGGLTKVLATLEAKGLIARGAGEADRRSKPARLTHEGRQRAERVMQELIRSDETLISRRLSPAEVDRATRLLRKLLLSFEQTEGAGG